MKQRYRVLRSVLGHLKRDERVWSNACVYLINLCNLFTEDEIKNLSARLQFKYPYFSKRLLESYGIDCDLKNECELNSLENQSVEY